MARALVYPASRLLLLVGMTGCASLSPRPDLTLAREEVRAAMARGARALEQHDWPSYTRFWANDSTIEVIHPAAREWVIGWDSTSRKYRAVIADTSVSYRITTGRQNVHLSPAGDMAWVTQEDRLEISRAGGRTQTILQWSTSVFEKRSGQWRLVHAHASVPPRAP